MRDSVPSGSYSSVCNVLRQWKSCSSLLIESTDSMIYFNKMKKEVGMLLQKRTDISAVGIYKLYEENTH